MLHEEIMTPVTQEMILLDGVLVTQNPRILNFDAQLETLNEEIITPVTQETIVSDNIFVTEVPYIFNFDAQTEILVKVKKKYTPKK